jgi:hypothetical protein
MPIFNLQLDGVTRFDPNLARETRRDPHRQAVAPLTDT